MILAFKHRNIPDSGTVEGAIKWAEAELVEIMHGIAYHMIQPFSFWPNVKIQSIQWSIHSLDSESDRRVRKDDLTIHVWNHLDSWTEIYNSKRAYAYYAITPSYPQPSPTVPSFSFIAVSASHFLLWWCRDLLSNSQCFLICWERNRQNYEVFSQLLYMHFNKAFKAWVFWTEIYDASFPRGTWFGMGFSRFRMLKLT